MKRFCRLFAELDSSNKTNDKVDALRKYFMEAPAEDAAWALWMLAGNRFPSLVKTRSLRDFVGRATKLSAWLVEECYEQVGDLAETVALLYPEGGEALEEPLHVVIRDRVQALADWHEDAQMMMVLDSWGRMSGQQRLVFNKLITGSFRVGVQRRLVVRALAANTGLEASVLEHRLMGKWRPEAQRFREICESGERATDPGTPYPFYLASPLGDFGELGELGNWVAEWKWDGIRAQFLVRPGTVMLWSRGDEVISDSFPELVEAMSRLPRGTVLDGEVLAWDGERPRAFSDLQKRLGRRNVSMQTRKEFPVIFMAYDLLEWEGRDFRQKALEYRRETLAEVVCGLGGKDFLQVSEEVRAASWEDLDRLRGTSRERGVEGFMLKRRGSAYRVGRVRGDWWKWKIDPLTVDAVMIYAESGHGRRANRFTDYTFAVWAGGELVPLAKAYSGLSDKEIAEVDRFVRKHTLKRFGPVRVVEPELVFELAFEGINESSRHKSGVALRFPRISRWRRDKKAVDADSLDVVKELMRSS